MLSNSSNRLILIFILLATIAIACNNQGSEKEPVIADYVALEKQMLKINSDLVALEDSIINVFIEHNDWDMEESGTGLRWMIVEKGQGEKAITGQRVNLEYKVYFLDGRLIYSSDVTGPKSFLVGHGGVESGLEEVILFLKLGDKARFILPSHLAYGLQGDGNLIPAKASLLYEVKLIDLE